MTIKEIARLSGYGVGTVSRVLNNNPNVSDKARKAIMKVVEANNFQPNENARRLRIQTHSGIAIIIKGRQNLLFEEILERMQIAFENADYSCSVYYIDEEDDEGAEALWLCYARLESGAVQFSEQRRCSGRFCDEQRGVHEYAESVQYYDG